MQTRLLTLAVLSALSHSAMAENQLLPIQVHAHIETETSQSGEQLLKTSGNSETGAVFRQISGVEASRLGGHGLDLVIRGQSQSQVNILIDGGKVEGGCPSRMDPPTSYVELSSFDKITVIKGIQSLQYGVGGTGGTVLLEREKPKFEADKPYQGEVYAATNSKGLTQDIGAKVSAGGKQGYLVLQGAQKKADNYKDGNGDEVRSSYETTQGHIDLGWTPSDHHHVKLSHEISNTKDALYQGAGMDAPKADAVMSRLSYKGQNLGGPINAVDIQLYHSEVEHVMDNYSLRTLTANSQTVAPSDTLASGAKLKLSSDIQQTKLEYGLLLQTVEKRATQENASTGAVPFLMWPDVRTQQNSLFAEANTSLSANQNLIYGVRVDQVNAKAHDATSSPAMPANTPTTIYTAVYKDYSGATNVEETNWNGLIRYEQDLSNNMRWFAGLSHTKRSADETERFFATRSNRTGNPDLKPEQHNQLDLGLSQTTTNLNWNLSAYYDLVNDYILSDFAKNQSTSTNSLAVGMPPNPDLFGTNGVFVNIDAEILGAEFDFDYKFNQAWLLSGALAYTQGRNLTDKRNLTNMAPLNGHLKLQYGSADWYVGSRVNFATEHNSVNTEFNEQPTNSWQNLDVFAGYQLNKSVMLQAGIDNLTDEAYVTHVNRTYNDGLTNELVKVMEPGRNIWARLHARF
ncbi:MAG: TonB-dependent receptor [Thiomicrospira sp.]|uniref:TonB-dependent receptor domain-containing protein n=1 Tax=Thiomicrospira sp. TaxID=935 RepID=UPI0019E21DC5|nr:TonB-dependent receptor [Thiomicrospira sp.]MBE0493871.1 TonB-dependent receptor [Thiomicrospira sp.]